MRIQALLVAASFSTLSDVVRADATKIVMTNDDGWATAMMRAQYDALNAAGYDVIVSAPALNQSGKASQSTTPTTLDQPCEFNTCPSGSPPEGSNATDPRLNYVNAFPVDAAKFGIQTLAPKAWNGAKPDLVVSGPNIGSNLGPIIYFSGTVGAACEAGQEGVPAISFAGSSGSQVSYTTLSDPTSSSSVAANVYSNLTSTFLHAFLSSPGPLLPQGVNLNVNYPKTDDCPTPDKFKFVMTRILPDPFATDVQTCGSTHLPDEVTTVFLEAKDCYASVSVYNATTKEDVDAATQGVVLNRLSGLLTCKS